ncbi:MAG: hypothetical protein ACJAT8_001970 [Cellvibrionaceae bacterium]|jgi:hypothetical protein
MRYQGHVPLHGPAYKTKLILIVTSEGRHNLCAALHSYVFATRYTLFISYTHINEH